MAIILVIVKRKKTSDPVLFLSNLVHLPMFSTKRSRVQEGRQSKSSPNSNSPWSGLDAVWIRFGSELVEVWMRFGSGLDQTRLDQVWMGENN